MKKKHLNFFHFCRCRLNQVLRSSEQLLSNKLVSLFAKSLESQVEVVEFDLEALLRVYTYESTAGEEHTCVIEFFVHLCMYFGECNYVTCHVCSLFWAFYVIKERSI